MFREDEGKNKGDRPKRTMAERQEDARRERKITHEEMEAARQSEPAAVEKEQRMNQEKLDRNVAMAFQEEHDWKFARKVDAKSSLEEDTKGEQSSNQAERWPRSV